MQTLTEDPTPTDASHLESLNAEDLETLVKRRLFVEMAPEVDEWLLGPGIERYVSTLRSMAASLHAQFDEYVRTGPTERRDSDWRRRAGVVYARVNGAIAALKPILAETHRAENAAILEDGRAQLRTEVHELRQAIFEHRQASTAAGLEPEEHDLALWAHIRKKKVGAGNEVEEAAPVDLQ